MLVDVLALLLDPHHGAYVRSAGWVGADAFQEVVERGLVPTYLTCAIDNTEDEDPHRRLPPSFPAYTAIHSIRQDDRNTYRDDDDADGVVQTHSVRGIRHFKLFSPPATIICPHQHFDGCLLDGQINDYFMSDYDRPIKSIHFTNVDFVTHIADYFMWICYDVTNLDMTPFSGLREVGEYFAGCCTELKSVTFHPSVMLTQVPNGFLFECEALEAFDMLLFEGVDDVPVEFLNGCKSLSKVDFGPFLKLHPPRNGAPTTGVDVNLVSQSLTSVGCQFLLNCCGLQEVSNLCALRDVTTIEDDWMSHCCSLTRLEHQCLSIRLWS